MLAAGTVLDDKWRIEGPLGQGGMGAVYAATHIRNQNRVAIKVLHRELSRDKAVRDRFLHEGYAANQVGHPGTVRVLDDGTTRDGHTYLVMERLEGGTLDAVAEAAGGTLPLGDVMRYAHAVLDVIATAHDKGIVHRDLKPENFFVCRDGSLKVLDFGIAQVKEAQTKARLTVTGVPMGTPAFMPPEQALAHWDRVDARADVYSIAATIVNLLTGRLLHETRSLPELLVAVSTRPAPPVRSLAPGLPPAIAEVLDRALAFEPTARWPNARAMAGALAAAANGVTAHPTLVAGRAPTASVPAISGPFGPPGPRVLDEPSTGSLRGVASGAVPQIVGIQTAAPVSSSSRDTARSRSKRNGWLLGAGAAIGCALAAGGAYFLWPGQAPTTAGVPGPDVTTTSSSPPAGATTTTAPGAAVTPEPPAGASASAAPAVSTSAVAASATPSASAPPSAKPSQKPPGKTPNPPATTRPTSNPLDFN